MATKEELLQEVKDAKDRVRAGTAYDAADKTEPNPMPPSGKAKKFAKGGSASSRADGIAQKGKTRGKVC